MGASLEIGNTTTAASGVDVTFSGDIDIYPAGTTVGGGGAPGGRLTVFGTNRLIMPAASTITVANNGSLNLGTGAHVLGNLTLNAGYIAALPPSGTVSGLGGATIAGNLTIGDAGDGTVNGGKLALAAANTVGGNLTFGTAAAGVTGTLKFSGTSAHTITATGGAQTIPALNVSGMLGGSIVTATSAVTFTNVTGGQLICTGATTGTFGSGAALAAGTTCTVGATPISAPVDFSFSNKQLSTFATELELK